MKNSFNPNIVANTADDDLLYSLFHSSKDEFIKKLVSQDNLDLEQLSIRLKNEGHRVALDKAIETYLEQLFEQLVKENSRQNFVSYAYKKHILSNISLNNPIKSVLRRKILLQFEEKLTVDIGKKLDIDRDNYIKDFLQKIEKEFGITKKAINQWGIGSQLIRHYFPQKNFHSIEQRKHRNQLRGKLIYKSLSNIENAYVEGASMIENNASHSCKFESGNLVETAYFNELKSHFGQRFDVEKNVSIVFDSSQSEKAPEFDIVICKKDSIIPGSKVVNLEKVYAAFEVKRKLTKSHFDYINKTADFQKIFLERSAALKRSAMPYDPQNESINPFQMLNGKVFFGLLATDIEQNALESITNNVFEVSQLLNNFVRAPLDTNYHATLLPDAVFVSNKADKRDITCFKTPYFKGPHTLITEFRISNSDNKVDPSVTSFGCLIKNIYEFFLNNSYISENDELFKRYESSGHLITSDTKITGVISHNFCKTTEPLYSYLKSKVPNEYSQEELKNRAPLQILRNWPLHSCKELLPFIKKQLKLIIEHEANANQAITKVDINNTTEFNNFINSLFKV